MKNIALFFALVLMLVLCIPFLIWKSKDVVIDALMLAFIIAFAALLVIHLGSYII